MMWILPFHDPWKTCPVLAQENILYCTFFGSSLRYDTNSRAAKPVLGIAYACTGVNSSFVSLPGTVRFR